MRKNLKGLAIAGALAVALSAGGAAQALAAPVTPVPSTADSGGPTLTFLGMTNTAVHKVRSLYPGAQLSEAFGTPTGEGVTSNVNKISHWSYIFSLPDGGAVTLNSTAWGEFGTPEVTDDPIPGSGVIDWAPGKYMDVTSADAALKEAGYTSPYRSITLQAPPAPGTGEACYIFSLADGTLVSVGIMDGAVSAEQ